MGHITRHIVTFDEARQFAKEYRFGADDPEPLSTITSMDLWVAGFCRVIERWSMPAGWESSYPDTWELQ